MIKWKMSFTENQRRNYYWLHPQRGGGVLPIMAYVGRPRPKGVPFFRLQVYERVGKSAISVCKAYRCILWLWKGQEKALGLWFVHTFKTVHFQALKGAQSSKRGKWKGYHLSIYRRYAKGVPFLSNRYIKGKGLDLGRSLPIKNLLSIPMVGNKLYYITITMQKLSLLFSGWIFSAYRFCSWSVLFFLFF